MLTASILCVLIGGLLGMRLNVFALLPMSGVAFLIIASGGLIRGDDWASIGLLMLLSAMSLQIGYLAGSAYRWMSTSSPRPIGQAAQA